MFIYKRNLKNGKPLVIDWNDCEIMNIYTSQGSDDPFDSSSSLVIMYVKYVQHPIRPEGFFSIGMAKLFYCATNKRKQSFTIVFFFSPLNH